MSRCTCTNESIFTMNRGKELTVSLCEKKFIVDALRENKRVDGRDVYDYRELKISVGKVPGLVEVLLGKTRVLAVVSCQVVAPTLYRPTEGVLFFNIELSPMASPSFEAGKIYTTATEINRILERCQKESRTVDTESLCIIAGKKVWEVRVDIHVLDHCGNIVDCASIASIVALKQFRRPDVTVKGEEATIHPVSERDPVPLCVHHMPICFTFAFFLNGQYMLVDPCLEEELVMEGSLVVGMNVHREICVLQMSGGVPILPELVLRCSQVAAVKCAEITQQIKEVVSGGDLANPSMNTDSILYSKRPVEEVEDELSLLTKRGNQEEGKEDGELSMEEDCMIMEQVKCLGPGTAELVGLGGDSTWTALDALAKDKKEKNKKKKKNGARMEEEPDSEEDETVQLSKSELGRVEVEANETSDAKKMEVDQEVRTAASSKRANVANSQPDASNTRRLRRKGRGGETRGGATKNRTRAANKK